ncbi:kinesin-like protein KIF19 isoform X2 [Lethenteron reissneri]|uniref:kinesin-like protein KIF19 isoform X2 n=1 Tax=Lethenteron reissneri TaxID=7753 RepID=UPI002AB7E364|nr:kinesin-like protein KIF19 isoform X2 [Lethenteron reissneri]
MKDNGESKDHQLTVALRIRPINDAELEEGASVTAHRVDEQMVVLMDPMEDPDDILRANRSREKTYMFDVAFDCTATQDEVYLATTKELIEGVISGYNATVFAYGPTGAGKTYTMLGTDRDPGIYMRTLSDLFRAIEATSDDMKYGVTMSYLEIYNEMIRDLLNPSTGFLDLREDHKGGIQIAGITEVSTSNAKEIMQLLVKGNRQRTQEPTAANKASSRSHAVLQVTVRQSSRVRDISQEVRTGRLFLIDLAGSERAAQTQNRGKRMKEGAHINRSLLALGNCINALSERGGRAQYVNYRDSKLTRLLKDSLGGNSRTVMIAHISPASISFEESRNTLTYADRAKNIKNRVRRNLMNVSYHIAQYTSIIADLRREIQRLKAKIEQQSVLDQPRKDGRPTIRHVQEEVSQVSRLREQLLAVFREQMEIRRSLMELENSSLAMHMDMSRHLLTISDWERERQHRVRKWRAERRRESKGGRDSDDGEQQRSGGGRTDDDDDDDNNDGDDEEGGYSDPPDSPEPPEVSGARSELSSMLAEQKNTSKLKAELEKKLAAAKARAVRLEESLPAALGGGEQRQVLALLCKVHELEADNAELESRALLRDTLLRQRDLVLRRYQQHAGLCDQVIRHQRDLIHDHHVVVPRDVEELYQAYLRELEEGNLDKIVALHSITTTALRERSLPMLGPASLMALEVPESEREDEGSPLDAKRRSKGRGKGRPARGGRDATRDALPPIHPDHDSDSNKVFKKSPKARQIYKSSVATPPPIRVTTVSSGHQKPEQNTSSLASLSDRCNSSLSGDPAPEGTRGGAALGHGDQRRARPRGRTQASGNNNSNVVNLNSVNSHHQQQQHGNTSINTRVAPAITAEIATGTKSISVIAERRRSRARAMEPLEGAGLGFGSGMTASHVNSQHSLGTALGSHAGTFRVNQASSEESLGPGSTVAARGGTLPARGAGPNALAGRERADSLQSDRAELQARRQPRRAAPHGAQAPPPMSQHQQHQQHQQQSQAHAEQPHGRKTRSRSFEVGRQALPKPKATQQRVLETLSDHKISGAAAAGPTGAGGRAGQNPGQPKPRARAAVMLHPPPAPGGAGAGGGAGGGGGGIAPAVIVRAKHQPGYQPTGGELHSLDPLTTPPSTVFQTNGERHRALALQKKTRGGGGGGMGGQQTTADPPATSTIAGAGSHLLSLPGNAKRVGRPSPPAALGAAPGGQGAVAGAAGATGAAGSGNPSPSLGLSGQAILKHESRARRA